MCRFEIIFFPFPPNLQMKCFSVKLRYDEVQLYLLSVSIYEWIFSEILFVLFCFNSTFRRKVQREERRQKTQDQIDRMKKKQRESELWRNRRSYLAPIAIGTTLLIGGLLLYYYYFWQIFFFLCKKKKMATSFFLYVQNLYV